MTSLAQATIAGSVRDRLGALMDEHATFVDGSDFRVKAFLAEADRLAKADALDASLLKAEIHHLTGDLETAEYWLANARRLGGGSAVDHIEAVVSVNLGFFERAARAYERTVCAEYGDLKQVFPLGLLTASFKHMSAVNDKAASLGVDLTADRTLEVVMQSLSTLQKLSASEAQVQAMLDVAGEVLRKHSLLWQERLPLIRVINEADDAAFLYQLRIGVDSQTACRLTDEVLEALIDRGMDVPGLLFSFVPTTSSERGRDGDHH